MTKGPSDHFPSSGRRGPSYVQGTLIRPHSTGSRSARHSVLRASAIFVSPANDAEPATTVVEPEPSRTSAS